MAIMHCPLAMTLYIKYCHNHNRETLRDIYNQYDDYNSQALWFVRESYEVKSLVFIEIIIDILCNTK